MTNTQTKQPSLAKAALKLLCQILGIVLALMLGLTWGIFALFDRISPVEPREVARLTGQKLASFLSSSAGELGFDEGSGILAASDSGVVNILLIGQDRLEGQTHSRSDAMILCSFNKSAKTLVLTSILRDLYVAIPGYQDNRVNAAYSAGGADLLVETLSRNLGIRIDGNVEVDFNQFAGIIDLLGGVTLDLRQDEADLINHDVGGKLTEGTCRLTGIQALTYARIRKLDADADFSRTSRQQRVLRALLDAYKTASFPTLLGLVDDILPMVTTDLDGAHMVVYAIELFPMLSDLRISTHRIPADGTYVPKTIRGMSVLVADLEANQTLLEEAITKTIP